jgi:hypothetical protein
MGNEENTIIQYVMFGKREQLVQFPGTRPALVLTGENHKTEFRPLYLFWDKADESIIRLLERQSGAERRRRGRFGKKMLETMAVKYMQSKYKEVFLTSPETLFLSESAQRNIPAILWKESVLPREEWFLGFGKKEALRLLSQEKQKITVFYVPEEDWNTEELWEWLQAAEKAGGILLENLCIFGRPEQEDKGEELLERFYVETGIAGSFYNHSECRRIAAMTKGEVLLLDCLGLELGTVGHPDYYIDAAGVRTEKEMRRLKSVCKGCQSLRMQLDRAFLGAL